MYEDYEKMLFPLNPEEWPYVAGERIWVEPVSNGDPNVRKFRMLNSPFHARGVSYLDIVRGVPEEDGEGLQYGGTIERSGRSTLWLMVPAGPGFAKYWPMLQALGCTYEGSNEDTEAQKRTLYSVDVPPEADIERVLSIIGDAQSKDVWALQVGYLAHKGSR